MTLTLTIVPASTKAGAETIRALLREESNPKLQAVYRDPTKAPAEFRSNPNFTAVQGDVSTGAGLDFNGSDAVFYVPPPPYLAEDADVAQFATTAANHVKEALEKTSVKRLVLLSSMGAQHERDIGILKVNHISDTILKTAAPEVAIVKPGYFMENWAHTLETAKAEPPVIYSPATPIDHKIPMVSLKDVGQECACMLLDIKTPLPHRTYFFDLFGPRNYSTLDIQAAVEELSRKKIEIVSIGRDSLAEFFGQRVPAELVGELVEMTISALPGGVMVPDFDGDENTVWGKTDLIEALRVLGAA
ncbi:hypothetical protein EsH8_IV_000243 [Colletotrichum jinshuiense]